MRRARHGTASRGPGSLPEALRAVLGPFVGCFWPFVRRVLAILVVKKVVSYFFKVILELFRKYLGIVFDLKRPTFSCNLSHFLYSLLPIPVALLWGPADALNNENPKDLIDLKRLSNFLTF